MVVFYRLSDSANVRVRVKGATKQNSLESFFKNFTLSGSDSVFLLADGVTDETYSNVLAWVKGHPVNIKRSNAGSEAGSFKLLLDEAVALKLPQTEYVYFLEDDYIHLPNSRDVLEQGLILSNYATLRLHPNKFTPPSQGGDPLLDLKGGETTKVYKAHDAFFMLTASTGMIFATSAKILYEDIDIWYWAVADRASHDFEGWLKLRDKGRTLMMSIPTWISHNELASASPLIGTGLCCWEAALHGTCECSQRRDYYSVSWAVAT